MTCHTVIPFPFPINAAAAARPVDPPQDRTPLRRPALLVKAAHAGQPGFRRARDLCKLLKCDTLPAPGLALAALKALEVAQDDARVAGAAEYDVKRHVMLLIAILAEQRAAERADQAVVVRLG